MAMTNDIIELLAAFLVFAGSLIALV
ncbi:cation:proton antiporter, partial [Escherichia coli]|nr:cation:proton antiporter [Escherichia coli]